MMDLMMMALCESLERTEDDFRKILDKAGLEVRRFLMRERRVRSLTGTTTVGQDSLYSRTGTYNRSQAEDSGVLRGSMKLIITATSTACDAFRRPLPLSRFVSVSGSYSSRSKVEHQRLAKTTHPC